jgi:hypothetical protein
MGVLPKPLFAGSRTAGPSVSFQSNVRARLLFRPRVDQFTVTLPVWLAQQTRA